MCFNTHIHTYTHTHIQTYSHYSTLHYITLHYITLHYTTLHYTTLHYTALHYITLHYITLHYITLHYITCIRTVMTYNTYMHTYIHAATNNEQCKYMFMRIYSFSCVYIYIYMYIYTYIYMCIYIYMYVHISSYAYLSPYLENPTIPSSEPQSPHRQLAKPLLDAEGAWLPLLAILARLSQEPLPWTRNQVGGLSWQVGLEGESPKTQGCFGFRKGVGCCAFRSLQAALLGFGCRACMINHNRGLQRIQAHSC